MDVKLSWIGKKLVASRNKESMELCFELVLKGVKLNFPLKLMMVSK